MATREHTVVRSQEVPNFDAAFYRAERIVTPSGVPVSLVYRKDVHPQGLAGGPFPLLLTGYGAYGCCQDPDFCGHRLSLLDRGVVYAIAHVRGGGEYGRRWYEAGRYLFVKNRFADFVEAAETLVSLRITTPDRLAAWGTSSGGLLVTASMNLRPDLFCAALLEVPFVDAMNTMSDPSIPLTVGEWEEVGNPNEREYFYYMQEYSPYDNIRMDAYPAVLATSSLNDSMVQFWEPLKYVSKLRLLKTDDRPVLLKVDFCAGHGATSDRYAGTRDTAFNFAFLLERLGLADRPCLR
jgi:oligopeptidase B